MYCLLTLPFRSALVAQGYKVSISHTEGTSCKTDAPMSAIWDVMRCWFKLHPSNKVSETSPAATILAKQPKVYVLTKLTAFVMSCFLATGAS